MSKTVPGWNRLPLAEQMLKRMRAKEIADAPAVRGEFAAFVKEKGATSASLTDDQREALFREFLQWRSKRIRPQQ
jgi:hypothetical protein